MAQTMIFVSWSTTDYPTEDGMRGLLVSLPPASNKHYKWCKDNLPDRTKWYINYNYPYYDVILDDEDMTVFKLIFGNDTHLLP